MVVLLIKVHHDSSLPWPPQGFFFTLEQRLERVKCGALERVKNEECHAPHSNRFPFSRFSSHFPMFIIIIIIIIIIILKELLWSR